MSGPVTPPPPAGVRRTSAIDPKSSSSSGRQPGLALRLLIYPLFFFSGAAGLIYEVVWTRILLDTFGAGLYAVCAVISAFMAGLALGSWLFGAWSDRVRHPLYLYGALEIGIAVCGLMTPTMLHASGSLDGWAYRHWGADVFTMLTVFRFMLAFSIMLVPTTLMGATLPVLSRFIVRSHENLGLHVGSLYATNTFGAVAGTFCAGFWLIASLGLAHTELTAAITNLAVGLGALALGGLVDTGADASTVNAVVSAPPILEPPSAGRRRWIMFTAFATGAVAIAAQVLWCRALVFNFEYLKNTTYSFTAMLTVFLIGLALGSSLIGLIVDQQRQPMRLYGILLTLIGLAMFFSVTMLYYGEHALVFGDPLNKDNYLNWPMAVMNVMLQSLGVLGLPTLFMGMAFPVAARIVGQAGHVGGDIGRLYALNTLGAILGSGLAGFVIIPTLGLTQGLVVLGSIDVVLGVATLVGTPGARFQAQAFGVLSVIMLVLTIHGLPADRGLQYVGPGQTQTFYKEGPLATVSVIKNVLGESTIFVDNVGVAGTDSVLQTDQKSLAHVPMMLVPDAKTVLTVGFGSGGASYSYLLHDRLQQIDCAEICRTVPEAREYLEAANHDFLKTPDSRYRILYDDARAYLTHTEQRYDSIATDCTDLRYKSNANLYDLEYFQACRDRLTPKGVVVVWMPLGGMTTDLFKTALRTFHAVFPAMGIFYMDNSPTHYILLVGWQDKVRLDYASFALTLKEADVKADLAELYLDDPVKLLSCFITGGAALDKFLGEGEINTENNPVIEFQSPKYDYGETAMAQNLDALMSVRVSPKQFLDPATLPAAEADRLDRYERALPAIIAGHGAYRSQNFTGSAAAYLKAQEIAPEDLSLSRYLLAYPQFQQRIDALPKSFSARIELGKLYLLQPQRRDAAGSLLRETATMIEAEITTVTAHTSSATKKAEDGSDLDRAAQLQILKQQLQMTRDLISTIRDNEAATENAGAAAEANGRR